MHGNVVGGLEQRVEVDALDLRRLEHFRLNVGVVRDDLDAEGLRLGRHQARDMAEADEAEHGPFDAADRHHRRHFPAAALYQFIGERDFADQGEEQRHGVVGDLADAVVRYVIDGDAFFLGGGQVDIVDAQAEAADRLAFGELAEDFTRELGIGHQDGVGILGYRQNVVGIDTFRHAISRIELRQLRLGEIERRKHAVGDSNNRAGHWRLPSSVGRDAAEPTPAGFASLSPVETSKLISINDLAALTKN